MFREIVGETPSGYRHGHGPIVAPNCVQMAAMRPREAVGTGPGPAGPTEPAAKSSSFGEASAVAAP
jgi:hypothetical protein